MRFEHTVPARAAMAAAIAIACLAATACATPPPPNVTAPVKKAGVLDGFHLFSRKAPTAGVDNPVAIGVNSYLWRASLDVLNFMPLTSADPYGGLIVTDWYTNPEKADERFKVSVYILDTRLRADGVNVSINRQTKAADGQWVNATTSGQTEDAMEDAILARARALRVGTAN